MYAHTGHQIQGGFNFFLKTIDSLGTFSTTASLHVSATSAYEQTMARSSEMYMGGNNIIRRHF